MSTDKKATLYELDAKGEPLPPGTGKKVEVQFNPETLKVAYANQIAQSATAQPNQTGAPASGTGDKRGTAPMQFTGQGTTRLTVQLWFDVTSIMPLGKESIADVRLLTSEVAYFITAKPNPNGAKDPPPAPPGVRFSWGTVLFDGVMESLDESLEFFSVDGVPLRASMNMSIAQGKLSIEPPDDSAGPPGLSAGLGLSAGIGIGASASLGVGTQPLVEAQAGVSLQAMASVNFGASADWQGIAAANNIENPRLLQPGQLINMNASTSTSASVSGSASASFNLT